MTDLEKLYQERLDKKKIKSAILAFSSVIMAYFTASAILADIAAHFAEVDRSIIQMVLTIPSIVGMVFALISGPLSFKISKKTIVVFGLICGFIGGMIALLFGGNSIYILLFGSVFIGVGQGTGATLSMALIADYFEGEEASSLMGLQSAFVNGGSMLILLVSGLLAGIRWNYSYIVYLIYVPITFIVVKNLPEYTPMKKQQTGDNQKLKLNSTVYFLALILMLYGIFSFVFQTNIAIYINSRRLGDASTSGLVNSLSVAAGMVTGIFYGMLKRVFKNFTISAALFSATASMFMFFSIHSLPGIFVSAALSGFGLALIMPSAMFLASTSAGPYMSATAIAITNAGCSIGMFLSPLLMNPIAKTFGDGSESAKFIASAIGLCILGVTSVIGNRLYTGEERIQQITIVK